MYVCMMWRSSIVLGTFFFNIAHFFVRAFRSFRFFWFLVHLFYCSHWLFWYLIPESLAFILHPLHSVFFVGVVFCSVFFYYLSSELWLLNRGGQAVWLLTHFENDHTEWGLPSTICPRQGESYIRDSSIRCEVMQGHEHRRIKNNCTNCCCQNVWENHWIASW